jgi:hypothetical protein
MVSHAPEFLVALIELNSKVLQEAVRSGHIGQAEVLKREQELSERARAIFERTGSEMAKVLQERHSAAGGRWGDSERRGSETLDEVGVCLEDFVASCSLLVSGRRGIAT